ncbi:MAG: PAS domain S-box protein, partial [Limisphaerales bacterium]
QAEQVAIYELPGGDWNVEVLQRMLQFSLPRDVSFGDFEVVHEFERIGRKTMLVDACVVALESVSRKFILLTLEDFSEWRVQADQALLQQAASVDASMDGIALHDANGTFVYMNQAHAEIYGYKDPNELIGKTWESLYEGAELRRFREEVMPIFSRIGYWRGEGIGKRKDGSLFPQELSLSRMPTGGLVCVVRDITERKRRDEGYARLADIVESAGDSIVSVDFNGVISTWNKAAERLHGYTAQEMIGKPLMTLASPEYVDAMKMHLEAPKQGKDVSFEAKRIRKDGREIDVAVKFSPIRDSSGKLVGASTIARDITERKRHEEANARLAAIVESSDNAIYTTDFNDIITTWNRGAEQLFGYSSAEAVGSSVQTLYPPGMQEIERAKLAVAPGKHVKQFETVRRHKDGSLVNASVNISPIINPRGEVIGLSRTARDISERKRAELERIRENRRIKLLADAAHALLSLESPRKIVRSIFAQIGPELGLDVYFNYLVAPSGDVLELNSFAGVPKDVAKQLSKFPFGQPACGAVAQQRRGWVVSHLQDRKDPEFALVRQCGVRAYACNPLVAGKKLIGTLAFGSCAHEEFSEKEIKYLQTICDFVALAQERALHQQTLEHRVAERTAELQESIGELEAFAYSVSHDMRAPLRAMRSFARILLEDHRDQVNSEGTVYLEKISEAAKHMDELIEDVLVYTHIVRAEVKMEPVDLDKLVRHVIATYPQLKVNDAQIEIVGVLPAILGNNASLTQCVSNLLANAVKFVAPGVPARVKIWSESFDSNVRVWFEDNGIGIDNRILNRIFGIFERGTKGPEYEGTGIGLAIVKKAIERIGGTVGVESQLGKGSRFWIELRKA